MLSNSIVVGVLATTYVLALVLQLNPSLPLNPVRLVPLAATVGVYYAIHLTVICYVLLVIRQLLAREVFSPAWISAGVLVWLGAAASAGGALLMWANLRTFRLVVAPATAAALASGAFALVAASALFVIVARLRAHLGARGRPAWAPLAALVAVGSVAAPYGLRGRGAPARHEPPSIAAAAVRAGDERGGRVTIVALDAASLDFITGAAAEGRLPNFGRILDSGAVVRLATLRPTSAEAVWAAVATGKLPQKNGVRSASVYRLPNGGDAIQLLPDYCFAHGLVRLGFLAEEPYTSASLRARPLWTILSRVGISSGIVGWPLTYPAPPVDGFLVSDAYLRLADTPSGIDDSSALSPPAIARVSAAALESAAEASAGRDEVRPDPREAAPEQIDRVNDAIARALTAANPVQVTMTRYQSLDPIGHFFLRYAMPGDFGDVTDEERQRLGGVLERHYGLIDVALGRTMAALGPDDLLLVVSGYGMEPLGLGQRIVERMIGEPDVSGTHESAPDGFLLAYGGTVAKGRLTPRGSVVDVVPTVLYFLGLPIGRDMDGYARTDLFQRSFTAERPIAYIPSYER
jgi:predicted AlkP superfamily phosphohydrolase/phosphomutase